MFSAVSDSRPVQIMAAMLLEVWVLSLGKMREPQAFEAVVADPLSLTKRCKINRVPHHDTICHF